MFIYLRRLTTTQTPRSTLALASGVAIALTFAQLTESLAMQWDTITYHSTWLVVHAVIPFWFIVISGLRLESKFVTRRTIVRGILLSTLIMWPLMVLHRVSVEVPYIMARTTDPMYDGVGGNAATLMMGWLLALILEIPHIILRLLLELYFRHRRPPPSTSPSTDIVGHSELDVPVVISLEKHDDPKWAIYDDFPEGT